MPYKYNPLLVGKLDRVGADASTLEELDDVNTAGTVNGKVLTFSSGTWIPASAAGGGDMLKAEYVSGAGTVYNASRLEGETLATVQAHNVALAQVPTMDDAHIPDLDTLSYGGTFAVAQIPNLAASKVTTGTFALARIPGTLTGKDADTVDGADAGVVANEVFKIPAGIAQGDIFHVASGGSVVNLSAGTSGHFLKTLGPGTNPGWVSVPGGGDMLKSVYDTTDNSIVDNSERLEGETLATVQAHTVEASKITSGTIGLARIPSIDDARIPDLDTLSYGAAFATAQIPGVGAYKIASGTIAVARHETLDNLNGTVALAQVPTMDDAHIPDLDTLSYGGTFAVAQIPNLGAGKTTSGTFNADRIPALPTARITTGTFNANRIPILPTDRYGSAVLLTGAQSIGGTKTFTDIPILPASDPTAENEAARKAYVDSASAGDTDGGLYSDTYVNTADIDGGTF